MTLQTQIAFAITPILPVLTIALYLAGDRQYGTQAAFFSILPIYLFFLLLACLTGIPMLHLFKRKHWTSALHYVCGGAFIGIITVPPVTVILSRLNPTYSTIFDLTFFVDSIFLTAASAFLFHVVASPDSDADPYHGASTE